MSTVVEPRRAGLGATDTGRRIWAIVGGSSGNLVEWYDFYVYSFTAIYFASEFFPKGDQTTQLLYTAGVFAVGFVMRPIGSWLFGRIADKRGRRAAMMIAVGLMCGGSLLVAVLPTYATLGVAAPALLLFARLLQGLSVGGEYGTSATYMSEVAMHRQRGFLASFQYVTLIGGQLLAVLVMCFGTCMVLVTVPVLSALAHVTDPYAAFGLAILALACVSFYTSISGLVKAELFPMHVRALGVGLSYAIANAAFGGGEAD
jgi:MFS family permease